MNAQNIDQLHETQEDAVAQVLEHAHNADAIFSNIGEGVSLLALAALEFKNDDYRVELIEKLVDAIEEQILDLTIEMTGGGFAAAQARLYEEGWI